MKFHRSILITTIANVILCPTFFSILNYVQRKDIHAAGINTALGWIFWLGMFCIVAPAFIRDENRSALFTSDYIGGTILLAMVNVAIPIIVVISISSE